MVTLSMQYLLVCYEHQTQGTAVILILLGVHKTRKLGTEAAEVTSHADKKLQSTLQVAALKHTPQMSKYNRKSQIAKTSIANKHNRAQNVTKICQFNK